MRRTTRCLLARPADKQVSKRRQPMNSTCAISHWTNLFESQHSVVIEPSRQYNIEERYVRLKNHGNVPISSKKTRENAGTGTLKKNLCNRIRHDIREAHKLSIAYNKKHKAVDNNNDVRARRSFPGFP